MPFLFFQKYSKLHRVQPSYFTIDLHIFTVTNVGITHEIYKLTSYLWPININNHLTYFYA